MRAEAAGVLAAHSTDVGPRDGFGLLK
jgi:hypothetical protein